jgi:hypothetical protein
MSYIEIIENGTMIGYYATVSARISANEKLNSTTKNTKS